MKIPLAATLLAAAAASPALAAPPVHTFSSSASVTGLKYELIDLTPDDGVTAGFRVIDAGNFTSLEAYDRNGHVERPSGTDQTFGSAFSFGSHGSASAFAAVGYDAARGVQLLAAGSSATVGSREIGVRTAYDTVANALGYGLRVELTPGTEMRWTGSFEAMASAAKWWKASGFQAASASIQVSSGLFGDTTPETQNFGAAAFANPRLGDHSDRDAGTFSFSFVNDGANSSSFGANIIASANGGLRPMIAGAVAPVPEPSTYVMLAAGLGVVGFVARRRKRQPQ